MKVLLAGDLLPHERVANLFDLKKFEKVLGLIRKHIKDLGYSIVNFECPICMGGEEPIEKSGPIHKCSPTVIGALQYVGFHCVTLANNHFRDFGDEGCRNTLKCLDDNGIDYVGGGMNITEASQILYRMVNDKRLAVINCCENEFSIATEISAGSNPLNPVTQYYSIREARKNADYVLVIVHGGHEMWQLPSPRMQEVYRFFIDAGADAVVNHHQHCFSGYEIYKDKPIFYGLGNFCFDKPGYYEGLWEYGYMVVINFADDITFEILPYEQCKNEPTIKLLENKQDFEKKIAELNSIISDKAKLEEETIRYYAKSSKTIRMAFEPYRGRLLNKLYLMGILPSFMTKKKKIQLQDLIQCESHQGKTLFFLTH